ncbi:anionic trypsin-2-like [Cimex lectularius]|uniref:Peptidase S1 domain-containing protein n=1 Tax=Cimex lectularius TaxID=79782 RepID=A0A8I6R8V9_CIMLE|nr:anionic trypsin-2-like [Cimex lectularius]
MFLGDVVETNSQYKFVVLLITVMQNSSSRLCTGVVVGRDKVLTAAHCFVESRTEVFFENSVNLYIYLFEKKMMHKKVKRVYIHPFYLPSVENDVAVVQTADMLEIEYPPMANSSRGDAKKNCLLAGFGLRYPEGLKAKMVLATIKADLLRSIDCARITENMEHAMCLLVVQGESAPCVGDSGGPIICNGMTTGILSRGLVIGNGCGKVVFAVMIYEDVYTHQVWLSRVLKVDEEVQKSNAERESCHILAVLLMIVILNKLFRD